jgi:hypothetical protein
MSRRYSREEELTIYGIGRDLRLRLVLLKEIDPALPRTLLVAFLAQEMEEESKPILEALSPSGQT